MIRTIEVEYKKERLIAPLKYIYDEFNKLLEDIKDEDDINKELFEESKEELASGMDKLLLSIINKDTSKDVEEWIYMHLQNYLLLVK